MYLLFIFPHQSDYRQFYVRLEGGLETFTPYTQIPQPQLNSNGLNLIKETLVSLNFYSSLF